jgi:hypothetical protein
MCNAGNRIPDSKIDMPLEGEGASIQDSIPRESMHVRAHNATAHQHAAVDADDVYVNVCARE